MIGRTLSHYRVLEKVGAGGMGVVYLARDTRLDRDVAIKALPQGALADEAARRRFRNEVLALSRLNHPHIVTVHDFNTADDVDFLVMEYVPGTTLDRRLAGEPMTEEETASLGIQVAEALEEAHEQGVIHRDLKPGNIMVSRKGQAKVLDFGLAKLLKHGGQGVTVESLTESQTLTGTLPYMAPEQLLEGKIDPRADLYALGAVLYEVASGTRPFREKTSIALANAILHKPPPPPRQVNPTVSPELERIILKCLEKDPEKRYQTADELATHLRRLLARPTGAARRVSLSRRSWVLGAGLAAVLALAVVVLATGWWRGLLPGGRQVPVQSLAVLPLENLSGSAEEDYFADGMTEELITRLTRVGSLRVISRTSAMRYKDSKKPLRQIARELKVEVVLEGSVLRSGGQVRITAQLVDAATDQQMWAESYERPMGDVLALQREVAGAVANEIRLKLTPKERADLASTRETDPEAQEAYLRGRFYSSRPTEGSLKISLTYYQQAVERDPQHALAHAGLAESYLLLGYSGGLPSKEAFPQAKEAALRALQLDESLAEAHTSLAYVKFLHDWDWRGAEREFQRAIALNPGYATAHNWYASYLSALGRHDQAIAEARRAQELDPLSLGIRISVGIRHYYARRYDQAIAQFRQVLEMEPGSALPHYWLGLAEARKGQFEQAVAELGKVDSYSAMGPLGQIYAVSGRPAEARQALAQLEEMGSRGMPVPTLDIAAIHAALGDKGKSFEWLEKGIRERASFLLFLKVEPTLEPLRGDTRFADFVRRVGVPQ